MLKWILLTLLSINTFALEIIIDSAKDNFSKYSVLHLLNPKIFVCQEIKNDFDFVTEIVCAFSKKPSQDIKNLQNDFFKVNTFIKDDTFFLRITPKYKIHLLAEIFDLSVDDTIYKADVTIAKRWMVLAYKDKLPLINQRQKSDVLINFPFFMQKDKLPYVGSLDIKGNPVYIKKVGDVTNYLKVKKYYKNKQYDKCMSLVDDILMEYPNTLFKAELLYYKINLYNRLKDYDNVVSNAKVFLREYSADENIPEVLSLIAKAYFKIGMNTDADYFFDRLFSEHKNSVFSKWAFIYKGEMLEESGGLSKAIKIYKKAFYETTNVDVAVDAAFHLALTLENSQSKKSINYINKILKAKPSYFKQKYKEATQMMHDYADEYHYLIASSMALALLNEIDASYDDYEALLKDRALWLSKTEKKIQALKALNKYLKQFPDGDFLDTVEIAKDALFFEVSDLNASSKLLEYDKLIQTYENDTIGNRAVYEKAKLLLDEKKYSDIIFMQDDLLALDQEKYDDIKNIIQNAAIGVMKESLESNACKEVLIISAQYNITLSNEWDDGIYKCAMKGGNFELSKSIVRKHLQSKDLKIRKKWLYRYIRVDFATGNYSEVVQAGKDLILLIEDDKNSEYKNIYRYLFDTYARIEKKNEMIDSLIKIENIFGLDYKDIERYVAMLTIGNEKKDDTIVLKYANMVMRIQKKSHSFVQSPFVEFTLYQAYMNKENYVKALAVIRTLNDVSINKKERSRQKYLLGAVLSKLWRDDEAKKAYQEAIDADSNSAWAKLAQSAKNY